MTNYGGTEISYDALGNPLNWRNMRDIQWDGRQMSFAALGEVSGINFSYNADGIRTEKFYYDMGTPSVHKVKYVLDGTKILAETREDQVAGKTHTLYYFYDEKGDVAGFEYNGNAYFYQKNIQGDVLRLCNEGGSIVAEYTYDAWGKILSVTDANGNAITSNTHIANLNPFRYRSYYYDTETGFYYLNSRYYDPEVGRFLNADEFVSTGQGITGYNMFAYCNNNPVNLSDSSGALALTYIYADYGGGGCKPESQIADTAAEQIHGLINGQSRLPYADEPVGWYGTYGSNGCAVIATYNAFQLLGKPRSLKAICDDYFLYHGMLAYGAGGLAPWNIQYYLFWHDVSYEGYFSYSSMSKDLVSGDVIIFTVANNTSNPFRGFHTMAASYDGNMFTVYNVSNLDEECRTEISLYNINSNMGWVYGFRIWN